MTTEISSQALPETALVPTEARPATLRELARGDIAVWAGLWHKLPPGQPVRPREAVRLIWNQPGLRATLLFRVSHALWRHHVPALPGMVARLNLMLHGLDIPPSVEIGPGLYVPHPVGTVVMAHRLGARVSLISGITIGMRRTPDFPTLGDDVFVGAGARILGGIVIGAGANIGANAVVLKDVPPGATAVGVPAQIKLRAASAGDRDEGDASL